MLLSQEIIYFFAFLFFALGGSIAYLRNQLAQKKTKRFSVGFFHPYWYYII